MLINALNRADKEQRKELDYWIRAKKVNRTEKVEAVTQLYNEMGIDQLALKKIDYYYEDSKQYLDAVNLPGSRKQILADYARKIMHRNY